MNSLVISRIQRWNDDQLSRIRSNFGANCYRFDFNFSLLRQPIPLSFRSVEFWWYETGTQIKPRFRLYKRNTMDIMVLINSVISTHISFAKISQMYKISPESFKQQYYVFAIFSYKCHFMEISINLEENWLVIPVSQKSIQH